MLGTFFIGMALGPTLGGLLIAWTGNILSVYYLATIVHVAYAVVNWTVLPESLSPAQMEKARRKYEEALEIGKHARQGKPWLNSTISRLTAFARPLAIFIPRRVERAGSPGKVARRDWSLTLVAAAQACITMIFVSGCDFNQPTTLILRVSAGRHHVQVPVRTDAFCLDILAGNACAAVCCRMLTVAEDGLLAYFCWCRSRASSRSDSAPYVQAAAPFISLTMQLQLPFIG
jgi:MFS family permease